MAHADATALGDSKAGQEAEAAPQAATAAPPSSHKRRLLLLTTAVITLASLFGPISASGLWDPPELKVADLARRIGFDIPHVLVRRPAGQEDHDHRFVIDAAG